MHDGSYFVSDMQDYFQYIIKNYGEKTDNTSIRTYVKKTGLHLNILIWPINFIIRSITRSFIILNAIVFSFSMIVFNVMKLLVILFIKITYRIKTRYYLELLTAETIKLLRNTKSKTTKDENGNSFPRLEITEVVIVYFNIAKNNYQHISRVLHTFVPNKSLKIKQTLL